MGGIASLLRSLAEIVGGRFPPWILPVVAVALVALGAPWYLRGQRRTLARRRIAAMTGAAADDAHRLEEEAFRLAGADPDGLVGIADEALARGRTAVARRALDALAASGVRPGERRRLERALAGPEARLPEEEALAVERLIEAGLRERAAWRLARARERFPGRPEWDDLAGRMAADREGGPTDPGTAGST